MARKRNGMNIYKRRDGRYEGRYIVVDADTGARKMRYTYGGTYKEVFDRLVEIKAGKAKPPIKTSMTVGEIFALWLAHITPRVKQSTYANYKMKIDTHIFPVLGGVRYDFLTAEKLNRFIADKAQSGRVKNGGALSERYVRDIAVLIKSVCGFAAKNHGFHNPAANLELPKPAKNELAMLNIDEQNKLVKTLLTAENLFYTGVLLSVYSGVRIGELAALTWNDIDIKNRKIYIRRTLQRVKNFDKTCAGKTKLILTAPKSGASQRTIPIPDCLLPILEKSKADDNCYVLSGTCNPVEPRTIQNRFKRILKNAELPSLNFHSLRHMFATNCLQRGFDVKTLSELLGHSDATVTLKRYVHSSDERKRECMNMLNFGFKVSC